MRNTNAPIWSIRILLAALLLAVHPVRAQQSSDRQATLSGFVTDASDGQPLAGAHVVLEHLAADSTVLRGAVTDRDGLYLIPRLAPGRHAMRVSFVGYTSYADTLRLAAGERHTASVMLIPDEAALEEVIVEDDRGGATDLLAGQQTIQPAEIERVPTPDVGGDLTSYLTTLPSVVATADRGGQLFIRGGEPSQNLVLLDGMVLYQPFHLLGFYSAFPTDIINHTDLYAGGFGAKYGERLSSVIDVAARTGNKQRFAGSASLSPFMSAARLEGPVVPGHVSVLATARQSMLEHGAEPLLGKDLPFTFGDAFGKVHAALSDYSRLSVSAIRTYDRGTLAADATGTDTDAAQEVRWQNWGTGVRYLATPHLLPVVADLHVTFSGLRTALGPRDAPTRSSRVRTTRIALDATFPGNRMTLQSGFQGQFVRFTNDLGGLYQNTATEALSTLSHFAIYLEPEWAVGEALRVRPGARLQFLQSRFDPFLVPRLRVIWERDPHRVSASVGRHYQEIVGLNDRRDAANVFTAWTNIPKYRELPPEDVRAGRTPHATHAVLGYRVRLNAAAELSLEGFYKHFADLFIAEWTAFPQLSTRLQSAEGRAFGVETRLEAHRGPFYGYLGYGYANTVYDAQQAQLELWYGTEELRFRPPHDRRHQLSALAAVTLAGFDVSVRWQFGSGRPFNRVIGFDGFALVAYVEDAKDVPGTRRVIYERPFEGILPTYHRLDASVERAFALGYDVELAVQASVVNAYDRRNIFYLDTFTLERADQLPLTPSLGLAVRYR